MDSRHFSLEEFRSHDGALPPPEMYARIEKLMGLLDVIRDEWRGPLVVVSGYRTPELNAKLAEASALRHGGKSDVAKNSQHIECRAADIRPTQATEERVARLHALILTMFVHGKIPQLGGLGLYAGWVHVDVRPHAPGVLARWTGQGMGQSG